MITVSLVPFFAVVPLPENVTDTEIETVVLSSTSGLDQTGPAWVLAVVSFGLSDPDPTVQAYVGAPSKRPSLPYWIPRLVSVPSLPSGDYVDRDGRRSLGIRQFYVVDNRLDGIRICVALVPLAGVRAIADRRDREADYHVTVWWPASRLLVSSIPWEEAVPAPCQRSTSRCPPSTQ